MYRSPDENKYSAAGVDSDERCDIRRSRKSDRTTGYIVLHPWITVSSMAACLKIDEEIKEKLGGQNNLYLSFVL